MSPIPSLFRTFSFLLLEFQRDSGLVSLLSHLLVKAIDLQQRDSTERPKQRDQEADAQPTQQSHR